MKVEFRESFLKDLRRIKEKHVLATLKETSLSVESANTLATIAHLKKMHGSQGYYRIRVGDPL